jgi:hypothetical protein
MFKIRSEIVESDPSFDKEFRSDPKYGDKLYMWDKFLIQVEIFNQINIKARNTCQEADKVTSNWSIKRIMQRQPCCRV